MAKQQRKKNKSTSAEHQLKSPQLDLVAAYAQLAADYPEPFSPPSIPEGGNEMLFTFSRGGANILGDVYDFLKRYQTILQAGWEGEPPDYLKGFGALSDWVMAALGAYLFAWECSKNNKTIIQTEKMHHFAHSIDYQRDIGQISNLGHSILAIILWADRLWSYEGYYRLIMHLLEKERSKTPLEPDGEQKRNLYKQLEIRGCFNAYFFEISQENELLKTHCQEFEDDIRELKSKLGDNCTTMVEVADYLDNLVHKSYYPIPEYVRRNDSVYTGNRSATMNATASRKNIEQNAIGTGSVSSEGGEYRQLKESYLHNHVITAIVWLAKNRIGKITNYEVRNEILRPHTGMTIPNKAPTSEVSRAKRYLQEKCNVTFDVGYRPTQKGLEILEREFEHLKRFLKLDSL